MTKKNRILQHIGVAALATALPLGVHAGESDPDARIHQLEQMMQQMMEQRAEQDKQMQVMAEELKAMQQQMANTKEDQVKEKGKSTGNPVYASFKDGLVIEDGSGDWKLQLNGRVQTDYRTFDPEWKPDTFSVRRARLGGTFTFLKDFTLRVEAEYANTNDGSKGTTALTYGYLDYTRWGGAKIRAGQFKPFFGLERSYSTNFIDFTELSLATNNGSIFNSTYDRGVMLFGDPLPWLNYNAYVVNGTGQNNDDVNNVKDVGGRVDANLANLAEIKNAVLDIGFSASKGSLSFSSLSSNGTGGLSQVTEANGATFFSVTGLGAGNPTPTSHRSRFGTELAGAWGPVKLQSEYIHSSLEGWQGSKHFDNDIDAWYADLNWLITGENYADSYKSGIFGRIRPKHNFDSKDGWGAFEVGIRYSKFDASDFSDMLANTKTTATAGCTTPAKMANAKTANCYTSEADAWTVGLKWILNPNARIVLNYVHTDFDDPIKVNGKIDDSENAAVLRAQYDF